MDNFWDTKSLCKLRRDFFPVIVLRVYKHFFNISEMIDWLINFPWDDEITGKVDNLILYPVWRQTAIGVEWVFTCSKKLGESINPPKAGTSPHSSAHEQECGATWVSALHLCYNWAHCTEFTLCISAGWTLIYKFRTRLSVRTVGDTEGEKRHMFYFWVV